MNKAECGIDIIVAGERRTAFDIARDFIGVLSEGEWDDEIIRKDAKRLAALMVAYAQAVNPAPPQP